MIIGETLTRKIKTCCRHSSRGILLDKIDNSCVNNKVSFKNTMSDFSHHSYTWYKLILIP